MDNLSHVRVVLVRTTHPGNIGAAARAMKNMGLSHLALVAPRHFPSIEATARAAGAEDILLTAHLYDHLEEAIADCEYVVGASARLRTIAWPYIEPKECAIHVVKHPVKTAILFGREDSGLHNKELEHCHALLHIPCNPRFSSLNVASALQIVAYELCVAGREFIPDAVPHSPYATGVQMDSFYAHLEETLWKMEFLHAKKSSPSLLRRIKRLFNRARLEEKEIHLLRGILNAIQQSIKTNKM